MSAVIAAPCGVVRDKYNVPAEYAVESAPVANVIFSSEDVVVNEE